MSILARKTDESPGALAAELADARVAFETARASIIDRGVARMDAISAMIQELQAEGSALASVVRDADGDPPQPLSPIEPTDNITASELASD